MRVLAPHLSRSLGVMYRLRDAELKRVASLETLDRIAAGVALLDRRGAVHHLNAQANSIVARGDGLALAAGNRLAAGDADTTAALSRAIGSAVADQLLNAPHFSSTVSVPRSGALRPYVLQFAPLPERNSFSTRAGTVAAIVFLNDPELESTLDAGTLKSMFGITPAEARLAARLCGGDTLAAAAEHCGVEMATARSQLAALYDKTGCHSQAQLVRLLLSLATPKRRIVSEEPWKR
jgi:DNA-binding CsgD family transcriptional regulator